MLLAVCLFFDQNLWSLTPFGTSRYKLTDIRRSYSYISVTIPIIQKKKKKKKEIKKKKKKKKKRKKKNEIRIFVRIHHLLQVSNRIHRYTVIR